MAPQLIIPSSISYAGDVYHVYTPSLELLYLSNPLHIIIVLRAPNRDPQKTMKLSDYVHTHLKHVQMIVMVLIVNCV